MPTRTMEKIILLSGIKEETRRMPAVGQGETVRFAQAQYTRETGRKKPVGWQRRAEALLMIGLAKRVAG